MSKINGLQFIRFNISNQLFLNPNHNFMGELHKNYKILKNQMDQTGKLLPFIFVVRSLLFYWSVWSGHWQTHDTFLWRPCLVMQWKWENKSSFSLFYCAGSKPRTSYWLNGYYLFETWKCGKWNEWGSRVIVIAMKEKKIENYCVSVKRNDSKYTRQKTRTFRPLPFHSFTANRTI